jgi:DNA-directed RNA polymerase specialized sigma24 family protein
MPFRPLSSDIRPELGSGQPGLAARDQLRGVLEEALANLPEQFRTVSVLPGADGLPVEDSAEVLGIMEAHRQLEICKAH